LTSVIDQDPHVDGEWVADPGEGEPGVRGLLHRAVGRARGSAVLTHGAGSDCRAPLLGALAAALSERGVVVLRCDLPFRQRRPTGPPPAAAGAGDREGLARAVAMLRRLAPGPLWLGGQSYGARQATLLAAERRGIADGLLLLAYPLHPPGRRERPRSEHFNALWTPALFVHGSADPFGALADLERALTSVPAPTRLVAVEGAPHDLHRAAVRDRSLIARIADAATTFLP
jgi:uncharacterized protein